MSALCFDLFTKPLLSLSPSQALQKCCPHDNFFIALYQCLAESFYSAVFLSDSGDPAVIFLLIVSDLDHFKVHTRSAVSVREGQGVVLLCGTPTSSGGKRLSLSLSLYPTLQLCKFKDHSLILSPLIGLFLIRFKTLKGVLCSFGEEISIRREKIFIDWFWNKLNKQTLFCFRDWINWLNKLTLKDNTISDWSTLFRCGGPCHLSSFKQCSGYLIFLWGHSYIEIINIVNIQISSPKRHSAPLIPCNVSSFGVHDLHPCLSFRPYLCVGLQRVPVLCSTRQSTFRLPADGKPLHRQGGAVRRG